MNYTVSTMRGDALITADRLPAAQFFPRIGEVRLAWRAVPACRLDRCVAEVWRDGRLVESCLVRCLGALVYRDRGTGLEMLSSPAIEAEIQGRLVPAPRSSRSGEAVLP